MNNSEQFSLDKKSSVMIKTQRDICTNICQTFNETSNVDVTLCQKIPHPNMLELPKIVVHGY